jgi:REase_MTES_1575
VVDLAAVVPMHRVERAMMEAEFRRLADVGAVAQLADRHPGRRGMGTTNSILDAHRIGIDVTRSELESRFMVFVREVGLPAPQKNVTFELDGSYLQCDCVRHDKRVIVELDGRAAHSTSAAFERDRERDRMLSANGWRVVRITWRQLQDQPRDLATDLGRILAYAE